MSRKTSRAKINAPQVKISMLTEALNAARQLNTCLEELARRRATQFDFGSALVYLKAGKRVARAGWNGQQMFLFLVPGSRFAVNRAPLLGIYPEGTEVDYHAHIDMRTAQGYVVPWLASQADMLEEDWMLVSDQA